MAVNSTFQQLLPGRHRQEQTAQGKVQVVVSHWCGWGDAALFLIALATLLLLLRCQAEPRTWLLLGSLAMGVQLAVAPGLRQRWAAALRAAGERLREKLAPGAPLPWRIALVCICLPALGLYLNDDRTLGSGDTFPVMMTAVSMAREGNADLCEYFPPGPQTQLPYFVQRHGEQIYSSYPAGMNVFAVPVALAAQWAGADLRSQQTFFRLEKLTASLLAAACAGLFFLVAVHLAPLIPVLVTTGFFAVGSTQYSTVAQGLWQHGGVVFWGLLLLLLEVRQRPDAPVPWYVTALSGVASALLLATRLSSVLFLVPFSVWLAWRGPRRALLWAGWTLLGYTPWVVGVHWPCYGNWTGPSLAQAGGSCWSLALAEPLAGVLFSPARGLLVYQPWLCAGLIGLACCWRESKGIARWKEIPGWFWVCLTTCGAHLGMVACWQMWWGGHCWGSRLLADIMPWLALLCLGPVALLCRSTVGRSGLALVAVLSFGVHFVAVRFHADAWNRAMDIDRQPVKLWEWSQPPFIHVRLN